MNDTDYSGVEPLRVPEARRRVQAIEEYLKLPNPTSSDTARLASSIGLSRVQFGRLVRTWRDHRDARLLVIGKRGVSTRDYGLDVRATDIMKAVIIDAGVNATLAGVAPKIERRCAEENISPPARGTINNHLRDFKARGQISIVGPPRIVVGRMWFHLPIAGAPQDAMPVLLVAVALPERFIIAHEISASPVDPPAPAHIIDQVAAMRRFDADTRHILLEPDDRRMAAPALERAGLGRTKSHDRSVQRELSKAFGGRLGDLPAIHQRGMARPATKKVLGRQDHPLTADRIRKTIEEAIDTHNDGLPIGLPIYDLIPLLGKKAP